MENKKIFSEDGFIAKMDLKEINSKININHWYYQSKFLAVQKMLMETGAWPPDPAKKAVIVDIGAGSGIFIKAFTE